MPMKLWTPTSIYCPLLHESEPAFNLKRLAHRRTWATSVLMAMLLCIVGSVRADDNAIWLKKETKRQVAGCKIKSDSGIWLHTPDGIGHYKALWTRDYYYFVKYAVEFKED